MKLINGAQLTQGQRKSVLNAFVHRFTGEHFPRWANGERINGEPYKPLFATDEDWIKAYAFYFRNDGTLASKPGHCESVEIAEFIRRERFNTV